LGVDSKTVTAVRASLEATSEIPKLDKLVGIDGKERPNKQVRKPSIMAANEKEYNEAMDKVANQVAALTGQTFMSVRQSMVVLQYPDYWEGVSQGELDEWGLYARFIGADKDESQGDWIEWLRRKDYRTPSEWYADDDFRRRWGMKPMTAKMKADWQRHLDASLVPQQPGRVQ
jgi:hypothetical protein